MIDFKKLDSLNFTKEVSLSQQMGKVMEEMEEVMQMWLTYGTTSIPELKLELLDVICASVNAIRIMENGMLDATESDYEWLNKMEDRKIKYKEFLVEE